jgi:hypothetical protein
MFATYTNRYITTGQNFLHIQIIQGSIYFGYAFISGGVIFYTIILNIRSDVICSVMTEWDYFRTKSSGP